jgi:putative oxidoreductase
VNRIDRVARVLAVGVGATLFCAGAVKIADPIAFAVAIQNYRLLPDVVSGILALYLPWLEVLCGSCLILKGLYMGSLALSTGLIAVFLVAVISAKWRELDIACGCFGTATDGQLNSALLRLLVLSSALAVLIAVYDVRVCVCVDLSVTKASAKSRAV